MNNKSFYKYFTRDDIYYAVSLSNLLNANLNHLTNYQYLSYTNELIIKLDQITLGLLYSNFNESERNLIERALQFVIDTDNNSGYNLTNKVGSE